jgi:hypothetical protein
MDILETFLKLIKWLPLNSETPQYLEAGTSGGLKNEVPSCRPLVSLFAEKLQADCE